MDNEVPARDEQQDNQGTPATVGTRIDVVSDVICPWCFIGKKQLDRALGILAEEGLRFTVHWNPFQLNPAMPVEGVDRAEYRAWKFGSLEKSRELDRRVAEAAEAVGVTMRHDLMTRTPNTMQAHRLIWFAGRLGRQDAMVERLFQAYFQEGQDIGEASVLADCAETLGLDRQEVVAFLAGDLAEGELRQADQAARDQGVNGVPSFFLDGYSLFSGAMPAETMAEAFRRGREILVRRSAEGA